MSEWISDHDFLENASGWCGTEEQCRVCEKTVDVHTKTSEPFWSKRISLNATIAQQSEQIANMTARLNGLRMLHAKVETQHIPPYCRFPGCGDWPCETTQIIDAALSAATPADAAASQCRDAERRRALMECADLMDSLDAEIEIETGCYDPIDNTPEYMMVRASAPIRDMLAALDAAPGGDA